MQCLSWRATEAGSGSRASRTAEVGEGWDMLLRGMLRSAGAPRGGGYPRRADGASPATPSTSASPRTGTPPAYLGAPTDTLANVGRRAGLRAPLAAAHGGPRDARPARAGTPARHRPGPPAGARADRRGTPGAGGRLRGPQRGLERGGRLRHGRSPRSATLALGEPYRWVGVRGLTSTDEVRGYWNGRRARRGAAGLRRRLDGGPGVPARAARDRSRRPEARAVDALRRARPRLRRPLPARAAVGRRHLLLRPAGLRGVGPGAARTRLPGRPGRASPRRGRGLVRDAHDGRAGGRRRTRPQRGGRLLRGAGGPAHQRQGEPGRGGPLLPAGGQHRGPGVPRLPARHRGRARGLPCGPGAARGGRAGRRGDARPGALRRARDRAGPQPGEERGAGGLHPRAGAPRPRPQAALRAEHEAPPRRTSSSLGPPYSPANTAVVPK